MGVGWAERDIWKENFQKKTSQFLTNFWHSKNRTLAIFVTSAFLYFSFFFHNFLETWSVLILILPTKQALGLFVIEPNVELGSKVGIQATSLKAEISWELILASSVIPPDFERGPTGSTLHRISSLQNAWKKKYQKRYWFKFFSERLMVIFWTFRKLI